MSYLLPPLPWQAILDRWTVSVKDFFQVLLKRFSSPRFKTFQPAPGSPMARSSASRSPSKVAESHWHLRFIWGALRLPHQRPPSQ
jgi:hypothetical protein